MEFDLLKTVEYGGCSAKLPPAELDAILSKLKVVKHENLLVDIDTHDDAGVYKLTDELALIFTTDFFPPVCSDAYTFGQIAAANALSDVYAMGGKPLMALNLMMFSAKEIPAAVFSRILAGGQDKIIESGALLVGGHTIDDHPPKYGLAVVGLVHPDQLVTNAAARAGEVLILTKPVGTGALIAGQKEQLAENKAYANALGQMSLLNKTGAEIMVRHGIRAATDITGFGLLGHALKLARASRVSLEIDSTRLPVLNQAFDIFDWGCIPGAAFRNLSYVSPEVEFGVQLNYNLKMLANDAQTSGGLLMAVPSEKAAAVLRDLQNSKVHPQAAIIGQVVPPKAKPIYFN